MVIYIYVYGKSCADLCRGKGDYFRLGHGTDVHVRKPQMVEGLRGKKIVHVAVGALHCLAVTDTGQVCQAADFRSLIELVFGLFSFAVWLIQVFSVQYLHFKYVTKMAEMYYSFVLYCCV